MGRKQPNDDIYVPGTKVKKTSDRPFKSQLRVNTIKYVTTHEETGLPGYKFEEDDSVVECRRCIEVKES